MLSGAASLNAQSHTLYRLPKCWHTQPTRSLLTVHLVDGRLNPSFIWNLAGISNGPSLHRSISSLHLQDVTLKMLSSQVRLKLEVHG